MLTTLMRCVCMRVCRGVVWTLVACEPTQPCRPSRVYLSHGHGRVANVRGGQHVPRQPLLLLHKPHLCWVSAAFDVFLD